MPLSIPGIGTQAPGNIPYIGTYQQTKQFSRSETRTGKPLIDYRFGHLNLDDPAKRRHPGKNRGPEGLF